MRDGEGDTGGDTALGPQDASWDVISCRKRQLSTRAPRV
jgi:hypothetical protein